VHKPACFNPMSYCSLWLEYHSPIELFVILDGLIHHWNCMQCPTDRKTISF
jgi:hypothetical protein